MVQHSSIDHTGITGVGGGIDRGTAFPGSPSTGDLFQRSNIEELIFVYDGTRWVTQQMFTLTWGLLGAPGTGFTVDQQTLFAIPHDYQIFLVDWDVALYVSGAATWVISLQTLDTEFDVATLDSVSSASQNAAEMYAYTQALGDVVNATAAHGANLVRALRVFIDEQTGTASMFGAVSVRYRKIAT